MTLAQKISLNVRELPRSIQVEVFDFIEFIKTRKNQFQSKSKEWSDLSLSLAMREMKDEVISQYTLSDLKERFS